MSPIRPNDAMQARLRASADQKALAAVERHSDLRGEYAARVARHAVAAAAPELRTMYAQEMGVTPAPAATAVGLAFLAVAAAEVAAYVALFRQTGPKTKTLAATAIVSHIALFSYGRYKRHLIRRAAVAELAVRPKAPEGRAA